MNCKSILVTQVAVLYRCDADGSNIDADRCGGGASIPTRVDDANERYVIREHRCVESILCRQHTRDEKRHEY